MPIKQNESKLVQDVTLVSDIPTPLQAENEIALPDRTIDQPMKEQDTSVSNKTAPGKSIPKIHTRWRKVLGSKLARREFLLEWSEE